MAQTLNKEGYVGKDCATYTEQEGGLHLIYFTLGIGHFMVFRVISHMTTPKGQLPDEDRDRDTVAMSQKLQKVSSGARLIQSLLSQVSTVGSRWST